MRRASELQTIGEYAFAGMALAAIALPNDMTTIEGANAFEQRAYRVGLGSALWSQVEKALALSVICAADYSVTSRGGTSGCCTCPIAMPMPYTSAGKVNGAMLAVTMTAAGSGYAVGDMLVIN